MGLLSLLLFITPLAGIVLAINSQWSSLIAGIVIMIATPFVMSFLYPLERSLAKKLRKQAASLAMPVFYFLVVAGSTLLVWYLVQAPYRGDFWVFLFAWASCYVPYNYMLQAESAMGGANLITNVTNNFAVIGYLIFGLIMNYTNLPVTIGLLALIAPAAILMNGLPSRIRAEE